MGQLAMGVVGAVVGSFVPVVGTQLGFMIGSAIGGMLFPPDGPTIEGPKLSDLKTQQSAFGGGVPKVYGSARVAGNIIWSTDLIETRSEEEVGGKGGGGQTNISYSYAVSCAIALCEGPITGVRRIWANKELVYHGEGATLSEIMASDITARSIRVYTGSEVQQPDPTIEAGVGIGNTPAYRGLAYVVFDNLQLEQFGNRTPQFEFEVVQDGVITNYRDLGGVGVAVPAGGGYTVPPYANDYAGTTSWDGYQDSSVGGLYVVVTNGSEENNAVHSGVPMIVGVEGEAVRIVSCDCRGTPTDDSLSWVGVTAAGTKGFHVKPNNFMYLVNMETGGVLEREAYGQFLASEMAAGTLFDGHWVLTDPTNNTNSYGYATIPFGLIKVPNPGSPYSALEVHPVDGIGVGFSWQWFPIGDYANDNFGLTIGQNSNVIEAALAPLYAGKIITGITTTADRRVIYAFMSDDFDSGTHTVNSVTHWAAIEIDQNFNGSVIDSGGFDAASWAFDSSRTLLLSFIGNAMVSRTRMSGIVESTGGRLWIAAQSQVGLDGGIYMAELDSSNNWVLKQEAAAGYPAAAANAVSNNASIYAENGSAIIASNVAIGRCSANPALTANPVPLSGIVGQLCEKSGLLVSEYDVSELTDLVDGYVVAQQMPARRAIEPLQAAFFFDGVESDGMLKFKKRGRDVSAVIAEDDLAAHDGEPSDLPDQLSRTRAQEMELPREITVGYFSKEGDYQEGTQYDRRLITSAVNVVSMPMPILMSDQKGAQVASVNLYNAWIGRETFEFETGRKHALLDPADVVEVQKGGLSWRIRLTKRTEGGNGVIKWMGVQDDATIYTQYGAFSTTPAGQQTLALPSPTSLKVLDTVSLLDADADSPTLYHAASGYGGSWRGAALYESYDAGVNYKSVGSILFQQSSTVGYAASALGAPDQFGFCDEKNTVDVALSDNTKTLSNATFDQLLQGANAAYLGGEIVQFKNASQVSSGIWRLSGLLRGRKGTEKYAETHAEGEDFVLLDSNAMQREYIDKAWIASQIKYKAVSFGSSLSSATTKPVNFSANNLKPLAPIFVQGFQNASTGDWDIQWTRRTRKGGQWIDYVDAELGESSESYVVEIYDTTMATLKRTLTATSPAVQYTAADQATDFGSAQTRFGVKVYQVSAVVGRGDPSSMVGYGYGQSALIQLASVSVEDSFTAFRDMVDSLGAFQSFSFDNYNNEYTAGTFAQYARNTMLYANTYMTTLGNVDEMQRHDEKSCDYFFGGRAVLQNTTVFPQSVNGCSTVMVVKPNSYTVPSGAGLWCYNAATTTTNQYALIHTTTSPTNLTFNSSNSTTQSTLAVPGALTQGQWSFLATSHDGGTLGALTQARVYRDGDQIASGNLHLPLNTTRTYRYIGQNAAGTAASQGYVAEIANFNRALSAEEIGMLKRAWLFGAKPVSIRARSSKVAIKDQYDRGFVSNSGLMIQSDAQWGSLWARDGSPNSGFEYATSKAFQLPAGEQMQFEFYAKIPTDVTTKQCIMDWGSIASTTSNSYGEANLSRADGACLFIKDGVLNIGSYWDSWYPYSGAVSSTPLTITAFAGKMCLITLTIGGGTLSLSIQVPGSTATMSGTKTTSYAYPSKELIIGNFNRLIGPGDFPFLGEIYHYRFWVGV